jgi:2-oxoisovalerate dehydrogenase E2 component (dihydrolipoyl transacylase)
LRADLNAHRTEGLPKLTLLPFFMRAMVRLLPDFPNINAHYDEAAGVLRRYAAVHVGIATQTPNGLMVPVVRHAEARDLWDCARELARVTAGARDGSAARDELSGSTITLTSLGPLGGIAATPIINHPEVAIIGPNKLTERPVIEGAFLARRKLMNLSSSFDHRIVDGYDAASFIQRLKRLMEHPGLIFIDEDRKSSKEHAR